jgi:hypothetical protein
VGGVLLNQLATAVLHVQVLRLGDCVVVGEDDSAERGVDVAGLWEAAAAVAEPEEVPARNVTVGRVHGLGRGMSVDLEIFCALHIRGSIYPKSPSSASLLFRSPISRHRSLGLHHNGFSMGNADINFWADGEIFCCDNRLFYR